MSQSQTSLGEFVTSNPRMLGVLFTMGLLLTQAGSALGANGNAIIGP